MENVAVMLLLSLMSATGTLLSPFWSIVFDNTCTYFDGVWSKLIVNEGGIWCFSTIDGLMQELQLCFFLSLDWNLHFASGFYTVNKTIAAEKALNSRFS